ncbi:MAG: alpha/beta hydrolase [Candidatus Spechtbacterales bacterium]|nr:alpha/beta hydrolase [Candidatus Spechtbacterales bacterium]
MHFVSTKTSSGIQFSGLLSEPKKKTDKIIIHIHGMAGSHYENGWYQAFHDKYPKNEYAFLAGQHRGTGTITMFFQEPDHYPNYGNAFELFEYSVEDVDAWVNYARNLGYKEIYLQAHSFGPSKILYYVNQKPNHDIKALNLISPVDMLGFSINTKNYSALLNEAEKFVAEGKEKQLLSNLLNGEYYISAQSFLNIFTSKSKSNILSYTDRKHDWSVVNNINLPVMLIGGTKDHGIEGESLTTKEAFAKLKAELKQSPKVDSIIYEGADHSFDGFEDKIVKDFIKFVE